MNWLRCHLWITPVVVVVLSMKISSKSAIKWPELGHRELHFGSEAKYEHAISRRRGRKREGDKMKKKMMMKKKKKTKKKKRRKGTFFVGRSSDD